MSRVPKEFLSEELQTGIINGIGENCFYDCTTRCRAISGFIGDLSEEQAQEAQRTYPNCPIVRFGINSGKQRAQAFTS
jgi:hypothetical protein